MIEPRLPCIIGVARRTIHPEDGDAPEPLDLWEAMARAAAADSGGRDVLGSVDSVSVTYSLSWQYDDPPERLASRLGIGPGRRFYSGMSGTAPQKMIDMAATAIVAGDEDLALVVGAESLATKKRMKKAGVKPAWSHPPTEKKAMPFEDPFHPSEMAHQIFQAYLTFAMFDVARRARLELGLEQNLEQLGALFAPMSEVAAANPEAWFRKAHTPSSLITVDPDNRMVAHPYPKNLVSIMDIDMASGLLLASHEKADALGVPRDRRVYLRGWCHAKEEVYVAERVDLSRSVAMVEASQEALSVAGLGVDELAYLDLYSCFGSSVNFALEALGIAPDDARGLTITGGLPFHGGPGGNYLGHSVTKLVDLLRDDPDASGLVTGVGMHMTNHVFGVYSGTPGKLPRPDEAGVQKRVAATPRHAISATATGPATVTTYSVVHGRSGSAFGAMVCDLPGGGRCYARVEDQDMMAEMEATEWVGREVELVAGEGGVNLAKA